MRLCVENQITKIGPFCIFLRYVHLLRPNGGRSSPVLCPLTTSADAREVVFPFHLGPTQRFHAVAGLLAPAGRRQGAALPARLPLVASSGRHGGASDFGKMQI